MLQMEGEFKIYKAENKETHEIYIGATKKTIDNRKADHIQKSSKGVGSYFQEAIGTYGPEAFTWEQIDTANDVSEMANKEKSYILQFNSKENGYNSDCGGGVQKNIYQFSMDEGSLLGTYNSLENAANAVSASRKSISNSCLGYNNSCMGFFWSYDCTEPFVLLRDQRKKEVCQRKIDGKFVAKFTSVSEASRITGISKTCISRCCRGEREQTGGFLWKYI